MIAGGDPEHADGDQGHASDQVIPAKRDEENAESEKVHYRERRGTDQRNAGAVWQRDRQRSCCSGHAQIPLPEFPARGDEAGAETEC